MAGKVWSMSNRIHKKLVEAFGDEGSVDLTEFEDGEELAKIPDLWMKCWGKYHHPVYSLALVLNPEYHGTKPWDDDTVKADVDLMLKRYCPDPTVRATVRASLMKYQNQQGCFAKLDENGKPNDWWLDAYLTKVSPWDWFREVGKKDHPELWAIVNRVLKLGVASSCNERIFSAWKHIMGERRTNMGKQRQLDEVSIYTNKRVMKKFMAEMYADYDSAVSSSDEEMEESSSESSSDSE